MAHASTTRFPLLTFLSLTYPIKHHRISLRKGRGEQRVAKIYDSPCLPEVEFLRCLCIWLLNTFLAGWGNICNQRWWCWWRQGLKTTIPRLKSIESFLTMFIFSWPITGSFNSWCYTHTPKISLETNFKLNYSTTFFGRGHVGEIQLQLQPVLFLSNASTHWNAFL